MKRPVESGRLRRSAAGAEGRSLVWLRLRWAMTSLWIDLRRHPALVFFVSGYVLLFLVSWWCHFYLVPMSSPAIGVVEGGDVSEAESGWTARLLAVDPDDQQPLLSPRPGAVFGTDSMGASVLRRVLRGAAETLSAALVGSALAVCIGACAVFSMGLLFGRRGYELLNAAVSGFGFVPVVLIAWWLSAALAPGFEAVVLVIGASGGVAVVFALARAFAEAEDAGHVTAARAAGFGRFSILRSEVFPFVSQRLVSYGAMLLPGAVLLETALSFAGFGLGDLSDDNWGRMVAEGQSLMFEAPWLLIAPGLVIAVTVGWLSLTARSIRRASEEKDFLSLV